MASSIAVTIAIVANPRGEKAACDTSNFIRFPPLHLRPFARPASLAASAADFTREILRTDRSFSCLQGSSKPAPRVTSRIGDLAPFDPLDVKMGEGEGSDQSGGAALLTEVVFGLRSIGCAQAAMAKTNLWKINWSG
jgi:hypothetical protein